MNEPSAPDNPLLRWQEGELYEAEKNVLEAFREGWKEDDGQEKAVVVPPEGSNIPGRPADGHTAGDWQGAILRARFLRDLFLGNYGDFDPLLIVISRAWIEGRLDLNYCESRHPLVFSRCVFSDGISLRNAIIPELQLRGCEVRCSLFAQQSIRSINAQGVKVSGNVFLVDGFKANAEVNLSNAEIGVQFIISKSRLEKDLIAQGLKVGESVFLGHKFNSEVNLLGAIIGGQLDCDGGRFNEEFNGEVNLHGAIIDGQLGCNGGRFNEGLEAHNLKTGGEVMLGRGFSSKGVVNLAGGNVGLVLDCGGGYFEKGLWAHKLKTGAHMFLGKGFESGGVVFLPGANISGKLDCSDGHFEEGLQAQNLETGEDVILGGKFKSNSAVNLRGANIGGQLSCDGDHFEKGLTADGLRYQIIDIGSDWNDGLNWLRKMREGEFQPYEQLMSVYRRMGHTNWARNIGFELEKKRSKEFKDFWQWLTWRPWYGILRWTIGYGYKPFRFVPWALGLVMTGFLLFSSGHSWQMPTFLSNEWVPSEAEALESQSWKQDRKPSTDYLPFNPLIYSLEATFPVLPLGQLEKWHPSNPYLLIVRWALTLIGTPLLAILALFGAGVLGPRWRSGDEGD